MLNKRKKDFCCLSNKTAEFINLELIKTQICYVHVDGSEGMRCEFGTSETLFYGMSACGVWSYITDIESLGRTA